MKAVVIEWIDSSSAHGWDKIKDHEIETGLCVSIGFFIKENKDFILIAHSYDSDNESINGTIQIPKVAIRKKRFIQWAKKAGK